MTEIEKLVKAFERGILTEEELRERVIAVGGQEAWDELIA